MSLQINANSLATASKTLAVSGMFISKPGKSGGRKLTLQSKRDFTKAWLDITSNRDKPKKQAARDFEAYRQATLKEFNAQLATAIASGSIVAERVNADKMGDLRNISLVRRSTREQDQNKAALAKVAELTGIPVEQLIKQAKEHHADELPANITEVVTTPVESVGEPVATPQ